MQARRARRRRSRSAAALRDRIGALPPCRATSPWPRLALADDPTAPKWRNVAEAVTPSDRENVGFALERETSAHRSFRNFGWARGDQNNPPRKYAGGAAGPGSARARNAILTAWPLAAGRRRRPWRAQALAAAGLRAVGRATQHSLRSHSERAEKHRRTISTTLHIDRDTLLSV